jgi:hypothetical protein
MSTTPPELQHAAKTAAARVEKLLIEMLANQQVGEVAVVVSWGQLEPEKRVTTKDRVVKVGRGRMTALERVDDGAIVP